MSDKHGSFSMKLSAQTRARLLFQREAEFDTIAQIGVFSSETLSGLLEMRKETEKQRTTFLRHATLLVFLMFLVSNGQEIRLPVFDISISQIPGLNAFLCVLACTSMLLSSMASISVGTYNGLIDQFGLKTSGYAFIDPDIVQASKDQYWFVLKIFRKNFNIMNEVHVEPGKLASLVNKIAFTIPIALFILIFTLLYAYLVYFSVEHIENSYFGIGAKIFSLASIFGAVFLSFASTTDFNHRIDLNPKYAPEAKVRVPQSHDD